jgi:hypothetical protein
MPNLMMIQASDKWFYVLLTRILENPWWPAASMAHCRSRFWALRVLRAARSNWRSVVSGTASMARSRRMERAY